KRGETLGLVGESGCGKSTLGRLLLGMEKPTSGTVSVLGNDMGQLTGGAMRAARRNIQMVLQDPYSSLDPRMTVGDIVGEPFKIHPEVAPRKDHKRKVHELGPGRALGGSDQSLPASVLRWPAAADRHCA